MTRSGFNAGSRLEVGRRAFVAGGISLAGLSAVGCDALSTDPAGSSDDSDGGSDATEAPELADRVESGDLPELAERIPSEPLVVQPVDRPGVYGGDWTTAMLGISDTTWLVRTIGYENLMRWDIDLTEPIPNIAESVDVADDGREYTFHLRPGMKWSDGEPFTADDVIFAYDDVARNSVISPVVASWLTSGGEPAEFEKVDEVTFIVRFTEPHGLFLSHLATPAGAVLTDKPQHYLQEFHEDYNPDVQSLVDDSDSETWDELLTDRADKWDNPDLPVVNAWVVEELPSEGTRAVAVRNPYYWKTDPDGRQLPYLDRVIFDVIDNEEVMLTRASNGDFSFHARHFNSLQNKPVLASSREQGGFHFADTARDTLNEFAVMLNLTHQDPAKRAVFGNKDFRIGLSHAINRAELINAVFQQQGEPWQVAPTRDDKYFDEEMATQYTEYDVDLANEYLDRAFPETNSDGLRLDPDGNPIAFTISIAAGQFSTHPEAAELIRDYWEDVGVRVRVNPEDYGLWFDRIHANEQDAVVWMADPGRDAAMVIQPRWFMPTTGNLFMVAWRNWYDGASDEAEPEEPPESTKRQLELYDQFLTTIDEGEQEQLLSEIIQIAKEEFYLIGTLIQPEGYAIVRNDFHNVPEEMIDSYQYPTPAPTNPEQYFIE